MQDMQSIFTLLLWLLKVQLVCFDAVKVPVKQECKQSMLNRAKLMIGAFLESYARLVSRYVFCILTSRLLLAVNDVLIVSSRNKLNYVKMPKLNPISSWNTKR